MTYRYEILDAVDHGRGRFVVLDMKTGEAMSYHRNAEQAERARDRCERASFTIAGAELAEALDEEES
jgi:hypothetical protein